MKSLVVFYSRTNTIKTVAQSISKILKSYTEEIISVKNRSGPIGYILSGKEAGLKQLADIKPNRTNVSDYDLIIIGTPIWSWTMSSPIRKYLTNNKNRFKQVAFFCTMGSSGDKKSFKHMAELCGKEPIATLELTTKEVKANNYFDKVKEFTEKVR